MDMTDAVKEAYAYADPAITLFETYEISHFLWTDGDNIFLVDSDASLETPQGIFISAIIEASLPDTESSVRGQMRLSIDCLSKVHRDAIYATSFETDPMYVIYRQYAGENQEPVAELPVALSVSAVEFDGDFKTELTCLYPDLINSVFCRKAMTTTIFPGGRV